MASSEQRIALAERGMSAFNEGDMPTMLAALSEDVEVYASPEMANAGQYSGHDGFVAWITAWVDAWEEVSAEATDNEPVGEAPTTALPVVPPARPYQDPAVEELDVPDFLK